ncbi:SMP-30/gluconolactonase/LRE family protein [Nonomuraea longicatena]|uniref:SMP-30/gluconolactonase/LRE family protein n=2 Tax=Nonomuraea longicatena TaxID=83682 RepID=A0ABP3ZK16_9ACTN
MIARMRELTAEVAARPEALLGEAPLWDAAHDCLVWTDILAGRVHLTSGRTYEVGTEVGAALPAEGGGWLLAVRDGFATLDEDGTLTPLLDFVPAGMRCNDAKCDPAGRAWAGTVARGEQPVTGGLHRLDPGPGVTRVLDTGLANGLGWSPDGGTMWFADTLTGVITGYGYDDGELGPVRARLAIDREEGWPDGLCVDADGCLWIGLWGAGQVRRHTPDGRLDTVVRVPASRVTSCAFVGSALYVTTARVGLADPGPLDGALFAVETATQAPPATPWRRL